MSAGALLFAVGYWRVLDPMREDYDRAVAQLAGLQSKIQEGRSAKNELPKFREEVRQLELELDKLLRTARAEVPPQDDAMAQQARNRKIARLSSAVQVVQNQATTR